MADDNEERPANSFFVSAYGSLYDRATLPTKFRSGSSQYVSSVKNMLPLGMGNLVAWGGAIDGYSTGMAVRHGVTGSVGGNIWNNSTWGGDGGSIVTNRRGSDTAFVFNGNGEITLRETDAAGVPVNGATAATTYGASYELFANAGAKTVNAYAAGASSITFSGTIAADVLSTAYGYTPSLNNPRIGDVVRLSNNGATLFSYHRLTGGGAATWTISPNTIFTTAGGNAYQIIRTGWGSYSKVVQIFNTATNHWFDYYAGNVIDQYTPGTIEAAEIEGTTNKTAHYMCPQNSAAQDIKAVDVAYYKGFLLYGFGSAISWSVAGFPTSFAFGFGATDFPAGNTTVVALDDYFVGFEYLGEQLIALFRSSVWQVQASGSVPEFNFYKLPEQLGAIPPATLPAGRPSCSADGAIYYLSSAGALELTGGLAKRITEPVQIFFDASASTRPEAIMWESFSDSIFFIGYPGPVGVAFHRPTQFWSYFDCSWASASCVGLTGANPTLTQDSLQLVHYDAVIGGIFITDRRYGGPGNGATTSLSAPWSWGSPVIAIGDMYSEMTGIQPDINALSATYNMEVRSAKSPVLAATQSRQTAPIVAIDNRKGLLGKKLDDAFVSVVISGPSSTGSVMLGGFWMYFGLPQRR